MNKNFYPIGVGKYFSSPIGKFADLNNLFGIIQVNVHCPEDMKLPILLHKYTDPKTGHISTICPTGKWTGWYFSEELKYAVRSGYIIVPRRAYLYKRGLIFTKYVNTLAFGEYNMRKQYPKSHPRNLMCKLLLERACIKLRSEGMALYIQLLL